MKTYVWTFPTRYFHWFLVVGCILAYSLTDFTNTHIALGIGIGVIVLFRIVWGFWGPRYSVFKDFPLSIRKMEAFAKDVKNQERLFVGHNPLASPVMLAIIITAFLICIAGILTAHATDTALFGAASIGHYKLFKTIHEMLVYVLVGLVAIHLMGLVSSWMFARQTKTALSMITGYKYMPGINAKLTTVQKMVAATFIILAGAGLLFAVFA